MPSFIPFLFLRCFYFIFILCVCVFLLCLGGWCVWTAKYGIIKFVCSRVDFSFLEDFQGASNVDWMWFIWETMPTVHLLRIDSNRVVENHREDSRPWSRFTLDADLWSECDGLRCFTPCRNARLAFGIQGDGRITSWSSPGDLHGSETTSVCLRQLAIEIVFLLVLFDFVLFTKICGWRATSYRF